MLDQGMTGAQRPVLDAEPSMDLDWQTVGEMLMSEPALQTRVPQGCELSKADRIVRIHTDTRTLQAGDCLLALKGEKFDANDFLMGLSAQGATGAIAHHEKLPIGCKGYEVSDTTMALGVLGREWRKKMQAKLIAVTGSNGKTTVTQMIASILRAWHFGGSLATKGNFNNAIGVPLTLLRMRPQTQVGVVELGMNHPGEIESLAQWVKPDVALVNNAQREHQEFMKSVRAVAQENAQVFKALPEHGIAVFPGQDPQTQLWRELAQGHEQLTFGKGSACDVHMLEHEWRDGAWHVRVNLKGQMFNMRLQQVGEHNLLNALAAVACAHALRVPLGAIQQGLEDFRAVAGRTQSKTLKMGSRTITLVDDSYNANPDSVLAGIQTLKSLPGPHLLILGDMGEVGENGQIFHQEVGAFAKACGIEHLMCMGESSVHTANAFDRANPQIHHEGLTSMSESLPPLLEKVQSIWVKGSRFMRMEKVVQIIEALALQQEEKSCS